MSLKVTIDSQFIEAHIFPLTAAEHKNVEQFILMENSDGLGAMEEMYHGGIPTIIGPIIEQKPFLMGLAVVDSTDILLEDFSSEDDVANRKQLYHEVCDFAPMGELEYELDELEDELEELCGEKVLKVDGVDIINKNYDIKNVISGDEHTHVIFFYIITPHCTRWVVPNMCVEMFDGQSFRLHTASVDEDMMTDFQLRNYKVISDLKYKDTTLDCLPFKGRSERYYLAYSILSIDKSSSPATEPPFAS